MARLLRRTGSADAAARAGRAAAAARALGRGRGADGRRLSQRRDRSDCRWCAAERVGRRRTRLVARGARSTAEASRDQRASRLHGGRDRSAAGARVPAITRTTTGATASTPHPTVRAWSRRRRCGSSASAARPGDARGQEPASRAIAQAAAARASGIERARPLPTRRSARERESACRTGHSHSHRSSRRACGDGGGYPAQPPASRDSKRALMSLDEYVQKRDRGAS